MSSGMRLKCLITQISVLNDYTKIIYYTSLTNVSLTPFFRNCRHLLQDTDLPFIRLAENTRIIINTFWRKKLHKVCTSNKLHVVNEKITTVHLCHLQIQRHRITPTFSQVTTFQVRRLLAYDPVGSLSHHGCKENFKAHKKKRPYSQTWITLNRSKNISQQRIAIPHTDTMM